MGAEISYVILETNGKVDEYKKLIKDYLKDIYIQPPIPVSSEDFKIVFENWFDGWGIKCTCWLETQTKTHPHYTIPNSSPSMYNRHEHIFSFTLQEMPGCCAYLISTDTYVRGKFQGKGIAQFLQILKEKIAKDTGYPYLFSTSRADNIIQNHILIKNGWKKIDEGMNSRTANTICMWKKEIK